MSIDPIPTRLSSAEAFPASVDRLRRMYRQVVLVGGALVLSLCGVVVAVNAHLIWSLANQLLPLVKGAQAAEGISIAQIGERHPDVLLVQFGLAMTAIVDCGMTLFLVGRIVGPHRRLPKRAWWAILALPLALVGAVVASPSVYGAALVVLGAGFVVAVVCLLVGIFFFGLHAGLLKLAVAQAERRYLPVASDALPPRAAELFDRYEAEMQECGFALIGDRRVEPGGNLLLRLWTNASNTVYATASWSERGHGT